MSNKIAIYAICKNELQFVEKWYKSMREADYVVVLDTGSTDGTYEKFLDLAKNDPHLIVGQKTYNPWRFDIPRNDAMDMCPSDTNIFMSTDLDELLEPGWAKVLRESWDENKHSRCIYKYTWSHLDSGKDGRVFQYDKIHNKEWRWRYPVHELLARENTLEKYTAEETLILFNSIHLHHYPDRTKSRGNYLELLELRAKESKEDHYGLIYLAHEYYYRKRYDDSIKLLTKIITEYKGKYNNLEVASCYLFMGDCLFEQHKYFDAIAAYNKAIFIDPTYREPYIGLSNVYITLGKFNVAEIYLKDCLKESIRHYTWLERDTSWSADFYLRLGLAAWYADHKTDGLVYMQIAQSEDPTNELINKNIDIMKTSLIEEYRFINKDERK